MNQEIKNLRDGIFSLQTRRFRIVAELLIREKYDLSNITSNQHYDASDKNNKKIEIKFSRVLKSNSTSIRKENLLQQAVESSMYGRAINTANIYTAKFDCNIQQVKRAEFDKLIYGLFFADKIAVFEIDTKDVLSIKSYSDFQHKGNEGEGQFHINTETIQYHMDNHFKEWITYEEVKQMFEKYEKGDKKNGK